MATKLAMRIKYPDLFTLSNPEKPAPVMDIPRPEPELFKPALSNSIDAFYSKRVKHAAGSQTERVLDAIKNGAETQREISESTGIPRHLIPDRLKRLKEKELVIENGNKFDPLTKMEVLKYKVCHGS